MPFMQVDSARMSGGSWRTDRPPENSAARNANPSADNGMANDPTRDNGSKCFRSARNLPQAPPPDMATRGSTLAPIR
jgi:hypothetical protein